MSHIQHARSALFAGLLTGIGLIALPMATASQATPGFEAKAISAPQTRMDAADAIDASLAGAIIGAIVTSFDESDVQVKLDDVTLVPLDLEQSEARGEGQLKLGTGADAQWINFRYTALYDTVDHSASVPRLEIGGGAGQVAVAPASRMGDALSRDLGQRLRGEFPMQQPQVSLEQVKVSKLPGNHAKVQAKGLVDFGAEGQAVAQVEALYDARNGRLLRLDYHL